MIYQYVPLSLLCCSHLYLYILLNLRGILRLEINIIISRPTTTTTIIIIIIIIIIVIIILLLVLL